MQPPTRRNAGDGTKHPVQCRPRQDSMYLDTVADERLSNRLGGVGGGGSVGKISRSLSFGLLLGLIRAVLIQ